ncbi:transcription factor Hsf1 [Schizosaccharomyces japonicus yFS275]|uniref:Transcription factor Hsf1 n=1 Tax=Schizosaccharomyces japonicus (strain yFS275 / FY16936) TaxID=402676 RepID=B6K6Q0_SCHJY|nr:transcription factor Hsf1 [Schizosaccharomyces japonicus yFS275]EEB09204.2 transcription factor Hsf1 [Schizosaccharomyces japonicus yFS275]
MVNQGTDNLLMQERAVLRNTDVSGGPILSGINTLNGKQSTIVQGQQSHLPQLQQPQDSDRERSVPRSYSQSSSVLTPNNASALITSSSTLPQTRRVNQFSNKLYNMVNEPSTNNLICWSERGDSFLVLGHEDFAKTVLPRYFKHKNFSSFVRQLNMYGFHKVPHIQQGVLQSDSPNELLEFSNPNFLRDQPELLCLVTRKKGGAQPSEETTSSSLDLSNIMAELQNIKESQAVLSNELHRIRLDNTILWQENLENKERQRRHQETIDKILRFLASVYLEGKPKPTTQVLPKNRRLLLEAKVPSSMSKHSPSNLSTASKHTASPQVERDTPQRRSVSNSNVSLSTIASSASSSDLLNVNKKEVGADVSNIANSGSLISSKLRSAHVSPLLSNSEEGMASYRPPGNPSNLANGSAVFDSLSMPTDPPATEETPNEVYLQDSSIKPVDPGIVSVPNNLRSLFPYGTRDSDLQNNVPSSSNPVTPEFCNDEDLPKSATARNGDTSLAFPSALDFGNYNPNNFRASDARSIAMSHPDYAADQERFRSLSDGIAKQDQNIQALADMLGIPLDETAPDPDVIFSTSPSTTNFPSQSPAAIESLLGANDDVFRDNNPVFDEFTTISNMDHSEHDSSTQMYGSSQPTTFPPLKVSSSMQPQLSNGAVHPQQQNDIDTDTLETLIPNPIRKKRKSSVSA